MSTAATAPSAAVRNRAAAAIELVRARKLGAAAVSAAGFASADEVAEVVARHFNLPRLPLDDLRRRPRAARERHPHRGVGARDHDPLPRRRRARTVEVRPIDLHAPQDGRIKIRHNHADVDLRVSILPTYWGEKVVCRVLDNRRAALPLDEIGFTAEERATFDRMIQSPHGLVLVTNDALSAVTRLTEMGVEPHLVAPSLARSAGIDEMRAHAAAHGFCSMRLAALRLLVTHQTSAREVLRATKAG